MTPEEREASWDLLPDPEFVGKARALVRETLTEWGWATGEPVENVELLVNELYANSLTHGEPPISLALRAVGGMLRCEVTDHGPAWPQPARTSADDVGGRGLVLVSALADRWGIDPLPGDTGKTVWFYLESGARAEAKAS